ncbi:hypothetical protein ACHABX_02720 [Nesterenkonia halotolerans]|uniref:hypothetical protein n=1 Tax=Nesterenkonia halotolerans TaxID=225325 RepID=UPI003EE4D594
MEWNSETITIIVSGAALIVACIALYFSAALQRLQRRQLRDELDPIKLTQTDRLENPGGMAWALMNDSPRTLKRVKLMTEGEPQRLGSWTPGYRYKVGVVDTDDDKIQSRLIAKFWIGVFPRKQVIRFHWKPPSEESGPFSVS